MSPSRTTRGWTITGSDHTVRMTALDRKRAVIMTAFSCGTIPKTQFLGSAGQVILGTRFVLSKREGAPQPSNGNPTAPLDVVCYELPYVATQ